MTAVPRDAAGGFLPPGFRLDSVPVADLDVGDLVSWNLDGRAVVLSVLWLVMGSVHTGGEVGLALTEPGETKLAWHGKLPPDTTVNRVEVLRG